MARDLVVKVKHGDTLRRFNACVHENDTMNMDMNGLKAKIISLFNFIPDADLNITYIDEDGDVVTLVNDDDLSDAIRQRLNPLRLEVTLNSPTFGRTGPRTQSETSTPLRSPRPQIDPASVLVSGLEEALKSVPEPLANAIANLSSHLAAKAAASAPVINDLVEHISKIGQSRPGSTSQAGDGSPVVTSYVTPSTPVQFDVSNNPNVPAVAHGTGTSSGAKAMDVEILCDSGNLKIKAASPASSALPADLLMDLDMQLPTAAQAAVSSVPVIMPNDFDSRGNSRNEKGIKNVTFQAAAGSASQPSSAANPVCPFGGMRLETADAEQSPDFGPNFGPPFPRDLVQRDGVLRGFHRGVICDGCGMHPIVGPRFKSKVKENYDLCSLCFAHMGNEAEYTRIDRPAYRPPQLLREFYKHHPRFGGFPGHHGHHGRIPGMKHCKPKLESRFIQDITILDGTLVAPNTPFTKIWRMRNSGSIPWPPRTQLVWIGGDRFGDVTSVELEIPENGFPVDEEVEVAVDFVAPSRPGRYTSYWRMASPVGQKFGQRVWVLIQVEHFLHDFVPEVSGAALNLNIPPEPEGQGQKSVHKLMDVDIPAPHPPKDVMDMDPFNNSMSVPSTKSSELDHMVEILNEASKNTASISNTSCPPTGPFIPYPAVDLSAGASGAKASLVDSTAVTVSAAAAPGGSNVEATNEVEEALLKELADMGFKEIDLNKEVLRRNEYDLQESVDDLCSASEWDTILEELQEMGFCDRETNRKLLQKNGGSIKRVVLDLLSGEK